MPKFKRNPRGMGSVRKMKGNRRRPYEVRVLKKKVLNLETGKLIPKYFIVGYAETREKGLEMLIEFNKNPIMSDRANCTFAEVYEAFRFDNSQFTFTEPKKDYYRQAYNAIETIHGKIFRNLTVMDLEKAMVDSKKNYPTIKKIKVLFNQMYRYAMKNDMVAKDCSMYINLDQFKDKNPNARERKVFTKKDIDRFWDCSEDIYIQTILMLIYTGVRVGELLDLKLEDINMEEHTFKVLRSKTENGIRTVPIADCIYPFFENWISMENKKCEYLLHMPSGEHFKYRNYVDAYYFPRMKEFRLNQTPHCCRHTCISLLAEAKVDPTTIKKIVGHAGAMSLTERVYTHLDPRILIDAVNQMYLPEGHVKP